MNLFIYFLRATFIAFIINMEYAATTVNIACTFSSRPSKWTQLIVTKIHTSAEWIYDLGITALSDVKRSTRSNVKYHRARNRKIHSRISFQPYFQKKTTSKQTSITSYPGINRIQQQCLCLQLRDQHCGPSTHGKTFEPASNSMQQSKTWTTSDKIRHRLLYGGHRQSRYSMHF